MNLPPQSPPVDRDTQPATLADERKQVCDLLFVLRELVAEFGVAYVLAWMQAQLEVSGVTVVLDD